MRRKLGRIATALGAVYTISLVALLVLQRTPLQSLWWVRASTIAVPYLFLPILVLLPLAIVSRSRVAGGLMCVTCLLFVLLYGELFLPHLGTSSHQSDQTVTIMTYNLNRGVPGVEQILSIIESEDPDVLALQELSLEVAEAVSSLDDPYPYQALHPQPDGYSGSGVLSRYPIVDDKAFSLVEGMHLYQHAVLDIDGRRVQLLNVHLQPPELPGLWLSGPPVVVPTGFVTTIQDRELDRLIVELDRLEGTLLVVGDFNMTDQSVGYGRLSQRLGDSHREAGWGFGHTFPDQEVRSIAAPFPLIRIDYVFHSRDVIARKAYVGDKGGPDHRFLVAELSF